MTRDFVVTTYIIHKSKVLLHFHKKLDIWLPVGGHVEDNELPDEAALREAKEESGLSVELYDPTADLDLKDVQQLVQPMHVILEDIEEDHQHIDLVYYAKADKFEVASDEGETDDLKWFSEEELKDLKDAPDNAKTFSLEAIKLLNH